VSFTELAALQTEFGKLHQKLWASCLARLPFDRGNLVVGRNRLGKGDDWMIWLAGCFTISVALVFLGWLAMKSARIDWSILLPSILTTWICHAQVRTYPKLFHAISAAREPEESFAATSPRAHLPKLHASDLELSLQQPWLRRAAMGEAFLLFYNHCVAFCLYDRPDTLPLPSPVLHYSLYPP
jgi:hypothetical protein